MPAGGREGFVRAATRAAALLIAAGFASRVASAEIKGDRELGQYLSSQCTTCHQISGRSVGGVPSIVAWPEDQFIAVITAYKEGQRDNETMRTISHSLSLEEIAALAAYFGSLKLTGQAQK
ncbi:MAG: cytochrome c [Bradyrhizobium sp.]|uniref:c-type cytochrome n=1 Tax=Bradyrhizobium sp. TaxID=376 RepID=UPI003D0C8B67